MKIIAINGSPKGKYGNTYMLLSKLGEGIHKAQGLFEIINLSESNIEPCLGCYNCWSDNSQCVHNDDTNSILCKFSTSDIVILASPVYCHNVSLLMKKFIDRITFMMSGIKLFKSSDGTYVHEATRITPPIVLLSSCNLIEYSNFDVVKLYIRTVAKHLSTVVIAEICRTQTPVLKMQGEVQRIVSEAYMKSLFQAGYELVTDQKISMKTATNLRRGLVGGRFFAEYVNQNVAQDVLELF